MKKNLLFTSMLICMLFITQGLKADGSDGYFYYYYAKVTAKTASESSAKGCVYVSTTAASVESATAETSNATGQDPNDYGESTDAPTEAGQVKFYLYAKPASGYKFDGWSTSSTRPSVFESTKPVWETTFGASTTQGSKSTTNPGGARNSGSTASSSKTQYYCSSTAEHSIYAYFSEMVSEFTVSFAQPTNGSIKVGGVTPSSWPYNVSTTTGELTTTLTATPAGGYSFWGWYTLNNDGSKNYLSYDATYNATFNDATTVYAEFYSSSLALFQTAGVNFYDLNLANAKAVANGGGTIVVTKNGTVPAGNYTIASGVTLLIPFDDANTMYTTMNEDNQVNAAPANQGVFRKLTLESGAVINVAGTINVSSRQNAQNPCGGCVYGKYGQIVMQANSAINLNSGSNLYCWGYITGSGQVTANTGAIVHENFQLTDFRGGNCTNSINNGKSTYKVFPFIQYYIQNIEASLVLKYGSTEKVYTGISTGYGITSTGAIDLVGTSSGLFRLTSGASLTKRYDATNDRQIFEIDGNASLENISLYVYVSLSSSSFVLPLTNNISITVKSGTFTVNSAVAMQAGVEVLVKSGATLAVGSNGKLYVYDKTEWQGTNSSGTACGFVGSSNKYVAPLPYSPSKSNISSFRTYSNMTDTKIDIQGTLSCSGPVYTTTSGADICCSNGAGRFVFSQAAPGNATTYQVIQTSNKVDKWAAISVTSAKLHNSTTVTSAYGADLEYLATAGTAANTTITYANGHWGWVEVWKNGETVLAATNTVAKVNNASAKDALLSGLASVGYNASWADAVEDDTKQEVTHAVVLTPQEYTITYKDKGDAAFSGVHGSGYPTKHTYNTATTLVSPTKAGYNFGGWYSSSDCSGNAVTSLGATAYTANITLYAKWTPKQYTITFDSKGGSAVASITKDYGASVTAPANPTREGYTFNGWNPAVPSTMPLNGLTCVAQWKQLYTITWVVDGVEMKSEQIAEGEMPDYGETPTKGSTAQYEYSFTGWEPEIHAVNGDQTYSGSFNAAIRYYEVKFVNDNGGELQSSLVEYGRTPTFTGKTPTSTKTDGIYQFTGWSPAIAPIGEAVTYTAQYTKLMALTVDEGETLNVGITTEVTTTTVHVAGQLNVASETTLTTTDLILEATPSRSGEIKGAGSVTATNAYFHFSQEGGFKARTWYAVAVPWQVNVPAYDKEHNGVYIKTGNGEFVQQELGSTFDLIYYDGYRRSQGATKAWNYVEDDDASQQVMYPGRAYMIYLTADADTIRFKKNSETLLYTNVPVARYASDNGNLADWNGIANPAIYKAYLNVGATKDKGQIYNPDTKQYEWFDMKNNQLQVGQPIFVQSTVSGTILANANEYASSSLAPRRAKESVKPITDYELMLAASDADVSDRIIVSTDEDKEADEYIVGQDLAKMGVSSVVAQMWIDRYDSKMCINTVAPINNTADYPLGISVQKDGEYDLFIDDQPNDETMLYLTYDGEAIWNLSYGGYVATLTKGTNTHYGLRIVYAERRTPTGIEEATIQNGESIRKVLVDDKVFIIRGNNVYSIDGQLVK